MNTTTNTVQTVPLSATVTPLTSKTGQLVDALVQAALDPNIDVSKMERLYAMHKEAQALQAKIEYNNAMTRVQSTMPAIRKNKYNPQTKSYYADLANVLNEAVPVYTREGFSLSFGQSECPYEGCIRVTCRVAHGSGHVEEYFYENPIDDAGIRGEKNKTVTHGRASSVSYAQRYLTKMIFNLILEGEDNDGNGRRPKSEAEQKAEKWVRIAESIDHPEEYTKQRELMLAEFGGVQKMPQSVRAAFNRAKATVTPKDEE